MSISWSFSELPAFRRPTSDFLRQDMRCARAANVELSGYAQQSLSQASDLGRLIVFLFVLYFIL